MCFKLKNITLFVILLINFGVDAYPSKDLEDKRALFLKIEHDLKKGRRQSFYKHQASLKTYPLYPYLKYAELSSNLNRVSINQLKMFKDNYSELHLADKLNNLWLNNKAKHKQWRSFLKAYEYNSDVSMQCQFINAHYSIYRDPKVLKYVSPIWLQGKSQPKVCDNAFHHFQSNNMLTQDLIWDRIELAISKNNIQLARYLSNKLKPLDKSIVELWIKTHRQPESIDKHYLYRAKHRKISDVLSYGITKVAIRDPKMAVNSWKKIANNHQLSAAHWGKIVKSIAVSLANHNHPEAQSWLHKIPKTYIDKRVYDAYLKSCLYKKDWRNLNKMIDKLPEDVKSDEKWQYWLARTLGQIGNKSQSQAILKDISKNRSYYGFLSSLNLSKSYNFHDQRIVINQNLIDGIYKIPGVQRALELNMIKRTNIGRIEWRQALKKMSEKEKQAAAFVAATAKLPNWSITALANAENKNNLSLRFPKSYSNHIFKEAKRNNLSPELIFALTRQESAFIPTAKSGAGALGLMQLIPPTAKMVARKSNVSLRNNTELLKVDKNILLGSKYLRMMLDKYQKNPVLAMAAYNAGPSRVARWLPEKNMEADIWIETIPYSETKNYVQNILTYSVIYQQLLGKKPSLKKHMPNIIGKKKT